MCALLQRKQQHISAALDGGSNPDDLNLYDELLARMEKTTMTEQTEKQKERATDLVSINAHRIARCERSDFRLICIRENMTMQDALRELVMRVNSGDIRLTGEFL